MKKTIFLLSLSLAAILFGCSSDQENLLNPNIIYVLADDLGYGDLEPFNPECKISTPNLNSLASEGMVFTDVHTSSAVCTPTRYGILTGRYNWRSRLKRGVLNGRSKALILQTRSTPGEPQKNDSIDFEWQQINFI